VQRTKDEKRQTRHDAFLKSTLSLPSQTHANLALEIHDKKSTKRIRKRPKKSIANLVSLESTLDDIIAEDRESRAKKIEISVRPKGKEVQKEIERFHAVMMHPQFKANPLKAIRTHVESTWDKKEGMTT
jgi:hypothetical protein